MNTWTSGYVADIDYTYGYYGELNPIRSSFALLNSGIVVPEYGTACELGFGQGLSTNIHAAASNVEWYGTDFNPSQAGFAKELASHSQSQAKLYDEAFLDFCSRNDLPDFDFICLHGIWSWVSDENRGVIVDFVKRKLSVGGIVYISYNTQPGWAAFAPMRHLMTQHAEMVGSSASGIISRVDGAIDFAEKLLATNPVYGVVNPQVSERIKKLKEQDRHYLAHEYFNRDWEPMHFSTLAQRLGSAKLDFACSANYADHLPSINLSKEQIGFLNNIQDLVLRESVRDFMTNSQFRRDYWVRGKRKLTSFEKLELIKDFRVMLVTNRNAMAIKIAGARGEANVNMDIYNPVLDVLADNKVRTIAQIASSIGDHPKISFDQIIECILVLIGTGQVSPVQSEEAVSMAKVKTDKLNNFLLGKVRTGSEINTLASPVMGSGIKVSQLQQHFILAMKEGQKKAEDLASVTWSNLSSRGQKLVVEGRELQTDEENMANLRRDAANFIDDELPVLRSLQII